MDLSTRAATVGPKSVRSGNGRPLCAAPPTANAGQYDTSNYCNQFEYLVSGGT